MQHVFETDNMGRIIVNRLTIKDSAGRLETFENATIESVHLFGETFYQIITSSGEILYNPNNIIFLKMK